MALAAVVMKRNIIDYWTRRGYFGIEVSIVEKDYGFDLVSNINGKGFPPRKK